MKVRNRTIGDIVQVAEKALREIWPLLLPDQKENKFGGYLTLVDDLSRQTLLVVQVVLEEIPSEKASKYMGVSQEKALRLLGCLSEGHKSSWQSRDESQNQYGGAISTDGIILSFSGLPELADEAMMLYIAVQFGWLLLAEAHKIADISNNDYFRQLVGTKSRPLAI